MTEPLWEGPFPPLSDSPFRPKTRWEVIAYVYVPSKPSPCLGAGKCHGCLSWCEWCGDVKDTCDVEWPHRCDTHKRYPNRPELPKADPRQLVLPGVSV